MYAFCVYAKCHDIFSCVNGWFWWGDNIVFFTVFHSIFHVVFWKHQHQSFFLHCFFFFSLSSATISVINTLEVRMLHPAGVSLYGTLLSIPLELLFSLIKGVNLQWWSNVHYRTNKQDLHRQTHTHAHMLYCTYWSDHLYAVFLPSHTSKQSHGLWLINHLHMKPQFLNSEHSIFVFGQRLPYRNIYVYELKCSHWVHWTMRISGLNQM